MPSADCMPPGPALDKLVCKRLGREDVEPFSTDKLRTTRLQNLATEVLGAEVTLGKDPLGFWAKVTKEGSVIERVYAETLPLALCRATLRAADSILKKHAPPRQDDESGPASSPAGL
jgi:hypothetical protein